MSLLMVSMTSKLLLINFFKLLLLLTDTPTSHNNSSLRILNSSIISLTDDFDPYIGSLTPNRRYATHYSINLPNFI